MNNYYTISINGSLVGHIEADNQEEAIKYVRENWEIEAINDKVYDDKYGVWVKDE